MKLVNRQVLIGILLILLIISLFILTRSAEHISRNFVFILDQGRDYVFVRDMILNKKMTLIGSEIGGGYAGIQGIFQGPFHFYILSLFFLLFNGDPYGGVVYMGLFALFAIIAAVFLGKHIFRNYLYGLLMGLLITISPPLIAQSKFVWNPYPITVYLLLCFLFTYLSQKKHIQYIFLSGFFAAFTYNYEIATTVPLFIALILFQAFVVKLRKVKEFAFLFGGIIAGMLPFFLFEVRHGFMAVNGFLKYMASVGSDTKSSYGLINNHLDRFVYNFTDTFPHQTVIHPLFITVLFLLAVLFFVIKEKRKELRNFIIFLAILLASTIFVLSFLRNHIFMYYLYQLNLIYIFLFVYLFYSSIRGKKYFILTALVGLLAVYLYFAFIHGIRDFNNDLSDRMAYQKIKAKIDAVDYIYHDADKEPFGVFVFAPAVYTYPYDYLAWWRGKSQFNYFPTQSKDGLFYLLIEKDPQAPWRHKGWMETVIKEGKVLETKVLQSGLIIQKRCGPKCRFTE